MKKFLSGVILVSAFFVGCGGESPKPSQKSAPLAPVSHQAQLIESQSSAEVLLRATGIGANVNEAMQDSKLAALWFVLYGGSNPMLQTMKEREIFTLYNDEFFKDVNKYIAYESAPKSKKYLEGKVYVDRLFRLNTEMLRQDLIGKNIIKSAQTLSESLGSVTVAVLPKNKALWSDTQYQAAVDVVSEYLQDRNFEVIVVKAQQKAKKIIQKAALLSGVADPMYALAMQTGADIYISINLDKSARMVAGQEVKKASVTMSAFYTATAKQLGASTGYSPERVVSSYTPVTQEATNDAAEKVLSQIVKSWKREIQRGKYFKVVVTASSDLGQAVDRPLYKAMKSSCVRMRRNGASQNIFDYTLQCQNIEDTMSLMDKIENSYGGPGRLFRSMDSGSLLVLKIANSADDEIEIE